jgi:drug/metabolite transporter (DMT)-like permease
MYGLSQLPATLYVICANTEIVFETIMTKVILKRSVTNIQTTAVILVISGVCISLYNPNTGSYGGEHDASNKPSTVLIGVFLSLFSRFCSSLNTILAERLLGKDVKSKVGVNECAVANAVIPFFLSPICFSFTKEYRFWGPTLHKSTSYAQAVVVLLLITLSLSKQVDRLCKFAIVGAASTIFFAGVDAFMKTIAGVGCFLFFGDLVTWANVLGIIMITLSVSIMFYEKYSKFSESVPPLPSARKSFAERKSVDRRSKDQNMSADTKILTLKNVASLNSATVRRNTSFNSLSGRM